MIINQTKCIGCKKCIPYCVMGAITVNEKKATINYDECVECGVCLRSSICAVGAIEQQPLKWPRVLRSQFSDPTACHPETGLAGRGTAEMKTNDVTGRFGREEAGFGIEMGRPGMGVSLRDVEKAAMAFAQIGVEWEEENPTTKLMIDRATGKFPEDVLSERVLSMIIEFKVSCERVGEVLSTIKEVADNVDTVFSVGMISKIEPDGSIPNIEKAIKMGFNPRPNPKVNVGLGRPRYE